MSPSGRHQNDTNVPEISYDTVMQAVEAISDRAEIPMLKYYKEVIKWYESVGIVRDKSSTEIYCEDERLSLLAVGVRFQAVDVRAFENEIPFSVRTSFSSCSTCAARSTI